MKSPGAWAALEAWAWVALERAFPDTGDAGVLAYECVAKANFAAAAAC